MTSDQAYAFIHIPKTGGTTFRHILRHNYGTRHCDIKASHGQRDEREWLTASDVQLSRLVYPKLAGICGHRVTCFSGLDTEALRFSYFTMLREPKARFISHFYHSCRGRPESCTMELLRAYVLDPRNHNLQTRWISGGSDAEAAIEILENRVELVGLMERFDETMLLAADWLGLADDRLCYKTRNKAPGTAKLSCTEGEIDALITEVNAQDIALYKHVSCTQFPRQMSTLKGHVDSRLDAFRTKNETLTQDARESIRSKVKRSLIYKPLLHLARV